MKIQSLIVSLALSIPLLGFVVWRLQTPAPVSITAGVLVDRSDSVQDPCAALASITIRILNLSADHSGSTLTVFITGDLGSANQPVLLVSREAPTRRRLLKGSQFLKLERDAVVDEIKRRCSQQTITRTSPIYSALQDAIIHLRGVSPPASDRRLFVVSDLRETVEPHIRKALAQPLGTKIKEPLPVNNTSVEVVICGYAQTRDQQNLQNERLIEVWKQLFTDPSLVKFEPFCSFQTAASSSQSH